MSGIIEKWNAFCEWQRRPPQLIKKSDEQHHCYTCGEEYHGNYCPQCGQSASIGRYSFKNALLLFLDVWGMGNRGMFRTLRDLILRPGYMIRDYISGMQMAYFPPFKLLFLLTAFLLVIQSGVNLKGENFFESDKEQIFNGKTFVITGKVNHFANRNEVKAKIEELGGKVTGSVTSNTDYLINNDSMSNSSKNKKAKELGIDIITEEEFISMYS